MVGLKVLAFLSEYGKNMSENWVKRSVSVMMVSNLWIEIMTPVIGTCHWDKLQYLPRRKVQFYLILGMQMHQGLDDGVIRGVHVGVKRKRAFAETVKRIVSLWRNDPILRKRFVRNADM